VSGGGHRVIQQLAVSAAETSLRLRPTFNLQNAY